MTHRKKKTKGLRARIHLYAMDPYLDDLDSRAARLNIQGSIINETDLDSTEEKKFNDAGELITILGKWNSALYRKKRSERG